MKTAIISNSAEDFPAIPATAGKRARIINYLLWSKDQTGQIVFASAGELALLPLSPQPLQSGFAPFVNGEQYGHFDGAVGEPMNIQNESGLCVCGYVNYVYVD